MDQEKVGKFIAKMRKSNKLTQDDIARRFGVTSQSVSKWERGVNSPDISTLTELAEILGVGVDEILRGERNQSVKNVNETINDAIVEGVKFYEKKSKKKYVTLIIGISILFIVVLLCFFGVYYFSNYNQVRIYSMVVNDEALSLKGRLIINPHNKIITINKIKFSDVNVGTKDEIKAKDIMIELKVDDKLLLRYGDLDKVSLNNELSSLNDLISKVDIDESDFISADYFDSFINNIEDMKVTVQYLDKNDDVKLIEKSINITKDFSNNKIIYKWPNKSHN